MSKEKNAPKNAAKKKPVRSLKERRAAKREKNVSPYDLGLSRRRSEPTASE